MNSIPEWLGDEEEALRTVADIGEKHGYGNCIAHLQREWQLLLMKGGLPEETARKATLNREPYALNFHRPRKRKVRA